MTLTVSTLIYCPKPEMLYASLLVFRTVRVGFPTARIRVVINPEGDTSVIPAILEAAGSVGAEIVCGGPRTHWEFIEGEIRRATGPLVIIDPDVIFWESCEDWKFGPLTLLAGRHLPKFTEIGVVNAQRIHTSFMWFPDPQRLARKMDSFRYGTVRTCTWQDFSYRDGEQLWFFDTGAAMYSHLRNHTVHFGPEHLDAYDHIFCGSSLDIVAKRVSHATAERLRIAHDVVREGGDLSSLRGLWRVQEKWVRDDDQEEREMFDRWCLGNSSAEDLMAFLAQGSQVTDDLVDLDHPEMDRSGVMMHLVTLTMGVIPENKFYREHEATLRPVIMSSFLMWDLANSLSRSASRTSRIHAFAYREILDQVFTVIAMLVGGIDHARRVAREIHEFYHARQAETFEKWEAKVTGGQG